MQDTTEFVSSFCIAIASHISNPNRIEYLQECLMSLVSQSVPINIYLSISFTTDTIRDLTLNRLYGDTSLVCPDYLNIRVRDRPTSQMRHYWLLSQEIAKKHNWIMFCDDDDTYHVDRTAIFMKTVAVSLAQVTTANTDRDTSLPPLKLAGMYENSSGVTHHTQRQEYWCYCIHMSLLERFFKYVEPVPGILDDKCCDVLLGEYLRRKSVDWLYATIGQTLYHYRVEENADSVTGFIQTKQHIYTNQTSPPPIGDDAWLEYVLRWNDFLKENIHIFLHDTYLRTLVGCNLDVILRSEFKDNYAILDYVDQKHVLRITELYERVRLVCGHIYDVRL